MNHRRFLALALAAMGGLAVVGTSSPSDACTPVPPLIGYHVTEIPGTVPLDGVVVVRVRCEMDCPKSTPVLVVKDNETGEVVDGAQELAADLPVAGQGIVLVFRPAAPLADGHTYSVTVEGQDPARVTGLETRASADIDLEIGADTMAASVRVEESWYDTPSCCNALSTCGSEPVCLAKEVERYVVLGVHISEAARDGVGQYVQTVTFLSPEGAEIDKRAAWSWGGAVEHTYEDAAAEYCYQVTHKSLIDGATIEEERVCVPHGDAGETGVFPADMATVDPAISRCESPPKGFEDVWCAAQNDCEAAGGHVEAAGGPVEAAGGAVEREGCSVSPGRGASSGWALSAIGLALAGRAASRRPVSGAPRGSIRPARGRRRRDEPGAVIQRRSPAP
ncbi:hypothetical protein WMF18_40205 [Sorangium sp. So ce315]|uniref:hypothetical protein n=1 Tax=Sorangium sp. So ce315 TaxID=3133299 RepID=UPI003F5EAC7E